MLEKHHFCYQLIDLVIMLINLCACVRKSWILKFAFNWNQHLFFYPKIIKQCHISVLYGLRNRKANIYLHQKQKLKRRQQSKRNPFTKSSGFCIEIAFLNLFKRCDTDDLLLVCEKCRHFYFILVSYALLSLLVTYHLL